MTFYRCITTRWNNSEILTILTYISKERQFILDKNTSNNNALFFYFINMMLSENLQRRCWNCKQKKVCRGSPHLWWCLRLDITNHFVHWVEEIRVVVKWILGHCDATLVWKKGEIRALHQAPSSTTMILFSQDQPRLINTYYVE